MVKHLRRLSFILFFALMITFIGGNAYLSLKPLATTSWRGWNAVADDNGTRVRGVNPQGPAKMLRPGDEVVALRGLTQAAAPSATEFPWTVPAGYSYVVTIRRDGQLRELTLATMPYPFSSCLALAVGTLLLPFVCLLTGIILFLFKPNDKQAQLLAMLLSTIVLASNITFAGQPLWFIVVFFVGNCLSSFCTALMLHFFLVFPERSALLRRWPRLEYYLYLPNLLIGLPWTVIFTLKWVSSATQAIEFAARHPWLNTTTTALEMAYVGCGLLVLVLNYRRAGQGARRKVRVVVAGSLLGSLPLLAWSAAGLFTDFAGLDRTLRDYLQTFIWLALMLLPLSFGYAIARYRVIPISLIVRRGVRYLLVARGFVLIQAVVAFAVLSVLLTYGHAAVLDHIWHEAYIFVAMGGTMLCIGLLKLVNRRVMPHIDRRFFRESYDAQRLLVELGRAFGNIKGSEQLLQLVADKITATLHAERVAILLHDEATGVYTCAALATHAQAHNATLRADNWAALTLPAEASTLELLRRKSTPLVVDVNDPQSWVHARLNAPGGAAAARAAELLTLTTLDTSLLVPLATNDQPLGVISIAPRLGDLPCSHEDQQMLANVAWQTSFALENMRLFERERRREEQLRQVQKMEAIGRLAGGVAHDFNNLLTAINGYTDLALRKLDEGAPLRRNFTEIKKAAERAGGLTRQLLAFSRKQVLQPKVVNLNSVVAETDTMLRRLIGEDIDLLTVLDPALAQVKADPGQIEQVIMNLAVNARDAMPQGGKLTIATANVDLDATYARQHAPVQPGPYVMLAVSDTGLGMDAATQAQIFEPFFMTKELGKGTGLGLATIYGIVKQSGGYIWVYSEVGRGTTFKVYLPRVESAADAAAQARNVQPALQVGTETVLLVEDEPAVRSMSREILTLSGYNVLEAQHGPEALDIVAQHAGQIDLMLTDVVMPYMSGRELAARLQPARPAMRVLYMSGYTDDAIVHHGVLDSGLAFLEKPFTPDVLTAKVRSVLDN
ncbi:MAG: response regulator [Pyrinomonadaceae bacterium]